MKARKIVQIVTQMEGGGAQRRAIQTARGFRARGRIAETWFLYRKRGLFDDEPHIRVLWPRPPERPWDYVRIITRLWRELRRAKPDAVIGYTHYANILAGVVSATCGIAIRIASWASLPQALSRPVRAFDRWIGTVGAYTRIVCNSHATAAAMATYPAAYRRRMVVVPNGVAIEASDLERREARIRWKVPEDSFLFVSVGRLAPVKNHARVFEALGMIAGAHLAVAGDGELRRDLDVLAQSPALRDRVTLLGEVSPRELATVFSAADAFVLGSLREGFGIAVLEAALAGLPLVVSDIAAYRETLGAPDEMNALFFDPAAPETIASAMRRLMVESNLRKELGVRGRTRAQLYSVDAMVDGFLEVVDGRS